MSLTQHFQQRLKAPSNTRSASPFPHVIADNILTSDLLESLYKYWPGHKMFRPEGHDRHDLRLRLAEQLYLENGAMSFDPLSALNRHAPSPGVGTSLRRFWSDFCNISLHELGCELMAYYSGYLKSVYDQWSRSYYMNLFWLEDAPAGYHDIGLRVHTHYDHDPYWTITALIYLSGPESGAAGTTLFKSADKPETEDDLVDIVLNSRQWYRDNTFEIAQEAELQVNRLCSFLDGPLSFHGVQRLKAEQSAKGRKLILLHIALDPSSFSKQFGISRNAFKDQVGRHQPSESIRQIVNEDIKRHIKAAEEFVPYADPEYAHKLTLRNFGTSI